VLLFYLEARKDLHMRTSFPLQACLDNLAPGVLIKEQWVVHERLTGFPFFTLANTETNERMLVRAYKTGNAWRLVPYSLLG
jgi:hypothetical protein